MNISLAALARRLDLLEAAVLEPEPPPPTEEDIKFLELIKILMEQLEPKYIEYLLDPRNSDSALSVAVQTIAFMHMSDRTPLALPASFAEIYLVDPAAYPDQQCANCGFWSPDIRGGRFAHLEACPLCGGYITSPVDYTYKCNTGQLSGRAQEFEKMQTLKAQLAESSSSPEPQTLPEETSTSQTVPGTSPDENPTSDPSSIESAPWTGYTVGNK